MANTEMASDEIALSDGDARPAEAAASPASIYEVHLSSWMRVPEETHRPLTERELAPKLADYVARMGFTHVKLLDRGDNPPDMPYLIQYLRQKGVGVILDCSPREVTGSAPEQSGLQWDVGFAQDIRSYLAQPPDARPAHHKRLTFRRQFAFEGNYVLPLSHRELPLLPNLPGDEWQKFANLRLLLAYQYLQPGKKLLFMGHEFGQWCPWNPARSLDWHLTQFRYHAGVQNLVKRLNDLYRNEPALHADDANPGSFEWIDCQDATGGTLSWLRWDARLQDVFLVVFNFTPAVHRNFKVGAPRGGPWRELINTDAQEYGGSGQGNFGAVKAAPFGSHGRSHSLFITLPPLAAVAFRSHAGG